MKRLRKLLLGTAVTAIAITGLIVGSTTPAQADTNNNSTRARTICDNQAPGTGYYVLATAAVKLDSIHRGTLYLLYSSGSGYNCAVLLKDDYLTKTDHYTGVEIMNYTSSGGQGTLDYDYDAYQYYAGAVWVNGSDRCVSAKGQIGEGTNAARGSIPKGFCS
ncbi:MAG: hypothetical protein HOQ05_12525 [Corynebacteriales bacterium]|nr:hypothetical protein [Mycobacteriales bacterium]